MLRKKREREHLSLKIQITSSHTLTKLTLFYTGALRQSREPRTPGEAAGSAGLVWLLWHTAAFTEGFYISSHFRPHFTALLSTHTSLPRACCWLLAVYRLVACSQGQKWFFTSIVHFLFVFIIIDRGETYFSVQDSLWMCCVCCHTLFSTLATQLSFVRRVLRGSLRYSFIWLALNTSFLA